MKSAALISALNSHVFMDFQRFVGGVPSTSSTCHRERKQVKVCRRGQFMRWWWWWGWHCCDCRCRCCPLLSTPVYCNLYIETPDLGDGSLFKVDSTSLCFSVPERSGGTQPCDGQHAPQRRHARRSHAPGLLPGTSCPLQSLAPSLSHPSITISTLIPLSSIRYKNKHFLHLDILFQSFFLTLPRHQVPNLRNKLHSSSFDTFPSTFLSHSGYLNAPKLHTRLHLRPVEPNSVTQPSRIHQLLHLHHLSVSRPGSAGRVWGFGVWERGGGGRAAAGMTV